MQHYPSPSLTVNKKVFLHEVDRSSGSSYEEISSHEDHESIHHEHSSHTSDGPEPEDARYAMVKHYVDMIFYD